MSRPKIIACGTPILIEDNSPYPLVGNVVTCMTWYNIPEAKQVYRVSARNKFFQILREQFIIIKKSKILKHSER